MLAAKHPEIMSDPNPQAELLRSLGRLVRGLSALFWGLPIALIVCVRVALSDWLRLSGMVPPVLAMGLLCYGVWQLGHFQRQERIWRLAVERAQFVGIINLSLTPFLFWWNKLPTIPFYAKSVGMLAFFGLLFLFYLNQVLQRLAAMLPDETLRLETRWFTSVNLGLIGSAAGASILYMILAQITKLPAVVIQLLEMVEPVRALLLLFMTLLPLALTMSLIWKIKEVILASVFNSPR